MELYYMPMSYFLCVVNSRREHVTDLDGMSTIAPIQVVEAASVGSIPLKLPRLPLNAKDNDDAGLTGYCLEHSA